MTVRMGVAQRRARLGVRHHLATRNRGIVPVAHDLVALHATDAGTVFLSCAARTEASVTDVERALHDERSLVRMLGMRRTMWVVDRETAPLVQSSSADDIAVRERKKLVKDLENEGSRMPASGSPRWSGRRCGRWNNAARRWLRS